jgi:hypothetical protein
MGKILEVDDCGIPLRCNEFPSSRTRKQMPDSGALPVIFFMLSFYVFAIALLYVLARAWAEAISERPKQETMVTRSQIPNAKSLKLPTQ